MLSAWLLCTARAELAFVVGPRVIPGPARLLKQQPISASPAETPQPEKPGSAGALLLVGACLGLAALGQSRKAAVARRVWTYVPNEINPDYAQKPFNTRVPSYPHWINLRHQHYKTMGRKMRHRRQQRILKESNVWWGSYKDTWHTWYPTRDKWNLYKGPDSHPDNPHFPGASDGLRAQRGWAAAPMAASPSSRVGLGATLCGGSAKRLVRTQQVDRAGIVLKAHKKAAASSKNHGKNNMTAQHYGIKKCMGASVRKGTIIATQKGNNWYAGENVKFARNHSLVAQKDGILQCRGEYKHKEFYVVPWQYVEQKCWWRNSNTLAPEVYEPWMGVGDYDENRRRPLIKLRAAWEESEDGKEHMRKKAEKEEKQREYQLKIREYRKLKRKGLREQKEKVAAGDSESEKA